MKEPKNLHEHDEEEHDISHYELLHRNENDQSNHRDHDTAETMPIAVSEPIGRPPDQENNNES